MPTIDQVSAFLHGHGIRVQRYTESTPTCETAAAVIGCSVGEIAKTLLFEIGGEAVALVAAGDRKVQGGALKRAIGLPGKVKLPTAEMVIEKTGYRPGGVCPFLLPPELPVLVDISLQRFDEIYPAAGDDYSMAVLTYPRLLELVGGREVDVCVPRMPVPDG